jgi:hypothetical protein
MNVTEIVKEVISALLVHGPDRKCVIHIMETVSGLVGCPAECHLLKVFLEEVVNGSIEPLEIPSVFS